MIPSWAESDFVFETERLAVMPWHRATDRYGIGLPSAVSTILNARTTKALPPDWQGDYPPERSRNWVSERDGESPTLLAVAKSSRDPVGLVILFETSEDPNMKPQLRIGYVIAEDRWGEGFASELVEGLLTCAQTAGRFGSIIAGVEPDNHASVRVLVKAGFALNRSASTSETHVYTAQLAH